jgi:D-methionine transport system ATP-binding protein
VNKKYNVETNILFANISEIQERILGIIIVQIVGEMQEIRKAEEYLEQQRVGYIEVSLKEDE